MKLLLGYSGSSSVMYQLDPRVKLLWLVSNMLLIICWPNSWILALTLLITLIFTAVAGINLQVFFPLLKILGVIGLQFVIFQGFIRQEGEILFCIGTLAFYLGGALVGIKGMMLLTTLALLFLQFMMWTAPEELTLMLVKLKVPAKYAVLVGLALRFLPIMEKDLRNIYESQESRGLELTTTWQKAKGLLPVMLPLILRALKRAQEVALSMELKGYTRYP